MVLTAVGAIPNDPNDTGITKLFWLNRETLSEVEEVLMGKGSSERGVGNDMTGTVDFSGSKSCKLRVCLWPEAFGPFACDCDLRGGISGGVAIVDIVSTLRCDTSAFSFIDLDATEPSTVNPRLLGSVSFTRLRDLIKRLAPSVPFFNSDFSFGLRSNVGGLVDRFVIESFAFGVKGVDVNCEAVL